MIWLLRRLVVAPAVILLTVLVWVTLPLWLIVAAALSPVVPGPRLEVAGCIPG